MDGSLPAAGRQAACVSLAPMELIHTCYRITDPDRSVAFYEALGFEKRRELPIRDEAINIFMGLPGDDDRLELTYHFGVASYELGTGYGHIALTVNDLDGTLENCSLRAGRRGPRPRPDPGRPRDRPCLLYTSPSPRDS